MSSCTCRCRTTVAAAGKLLGTFRRRARSKTAGLRGLVHSPTGSSLSRDAAACASRDRPSELDLSQRMWLHMLVEVDVCVLLEAVDVVVDDVGVSGACAECCEGTSDGPGPLGPLPGSKVL